jgi:hypothetical protein
MKQSTHRRSLLQLMAFDLEGMEAARQASHAQTLSRGSAAGSIASRPCPPGSSHRGRALRFWRQRTRRRKLAFAGIEGVEVSCRARAFDYEPESANFGAPFNFASGLEHAVYIDEHCLHASRLPRRARLMLSAVAVANSINVRPARRRDRAGICLQSVRCGKRSAKLKWSPID